MARGFHVRLSIHDPEWLTPGHVVDVAREQGQWLSELEVTKFIPAAVDAAKALIAALEFGPFFVTFDGIDNFGVHGEATQVIVSVDSGATNVPDEAPVTDVTSSESVAEPEVEAAPESPEEAPSGEVVDEGA